MTNKPDDPLDRYKFEACEYAVKYVESGMVVGLGFGSTAIHALRLISEMIKAGALKEILAIPTADSIEREAREHGIPIASFEDVRQVDITIDGADEIDPDLNLIKGGGGALLREKVVAQATIREVIVADYTKQSKKLGTQFDLPIEVLPFGWELQVDFVEGLGAAARRRNEDNGDAFISDSGNYILDCHFGPIDDLVGLARELESRSGIVEHGLFLDLATEAVIAGPQGIQHLTGT